jgi:hypothetical protein
LVLQEPQNGLTVREVTAAEILPYVTDAARYDCKKQTGAAERVAQNGFGFILEQGGKPILGYTLEIDGGELFITSASGRAAVDLVDIGLEIVEAQAAGMDSVGFKTKRRGLVKKAQSKGYKVVGYIMRKSLK